MRDTVSQPMLAGKCEDMSKLVFPVMASPKLDGIRVLMPDTEPMTRKFKEIPNRFVRETLRRVLRPGMDGEIMVLVDHGGPEGFHSFSYGSFNACQSAVMREDGEPSFEFWAFDYVSGGLEEEYESRMRRLHSYLTAAKGDSKQYVREIPWKLAKTLDELIAYEEWCVSNGYEGTMVRDPKGPWKNGRSTTKEGYLLKIKRFEDAEGKVVGLVERLHNANPKGADAFGRAKRSSHKANKIPTATLGALVLELEGGITCEVGTGFDDALRKEVWDNPKRFIGKICTFSSQPFGRKDKPRFPVFKGFRDERDM